MMMMEIMKLATIRSMDEIGSHNRLARNGMVINVIVTPLVESWHDDRSVHETNEASGT